MRKKNPWLPCFILLISASYGFGQNTTTVNWFNNGSTLLRDLANNPLPQGNAMLNTDGDLVQLGYFSSGNSSSNFAGTWIPITGFGATAHTAIGDSSDLSGSGPGVIAFNTFFTSGSSVVQVYDATSGDTGQYFTNSSVTISNTTPPPGQILAIRFYDTTSGTSGHYNTVSSDTWGWAAPNTPGGGLVTIDLGNSVLEWEDSNNSFKTSLTVTAIPEPSTYALMVAGAVGFLALRRRTKM